MSCMFRISFLSCTFSRWCIVVTLITDVHFPLDFFLSHCVLWKWWFLRNFNECVPLQWCFNETLSLLFQLHPTHLCWCTYHPRLVPIWISSNLTYPHGEIQSVINFSWKVFCGAEKAESWKKKRAVLGHFCVSAGWNKQMPGSNTSIVHATPGWTHPCQPPHSLSLFTVPLPSHNPSEKWHSCVNRF